MLRPTYSTQTQSSQDGWNNLIGSIGLEGVGDTMNHLGFTLANLPDMLLGIFTGKTKSIGMNQSTMMPLAAIIAGTFINIDNVPRIVTLTPVMLDAYNQGALPLNVIANRVLSKSDAQQTQNVEQTQHASQRYEQSQVQEQSRGIR